MSWFVQSQFVAAGSRATFSIPSRHLVLGAEYAPSHRGGYGVLLHYRVDRFDELTVMRTVECVIIPEAEEGKLSVAVPDAPLEAFVLHKFGDAHGGGWGTVRLAVFHVVQP